jgi:hypothetical protein
VPRPGRVRAIKSRRSRGGLLVSFAPAPLAQRYVVTAAFSNGRAVVARSVGSARTVFIAEVPAGVTLTRLGVVATRGELAGPLTLVHLRHRR